jgi:hypothetical protein
MVGGLSGSIGAPLIEVTVQAVSLKVAGENEPGDDGDAPVFPPGDALVCAQPAATATIDRTARTTATLRMSLVGTCGSRAGGRPG